MCGFDCVRGEGVCVCVVRNKDVWRHIVFFH